MTEYLVPAGHGQGEYTEKRSRFIGQIWPVDTEADALALLAAVRREHYDARHTCFAYIIRDGGTVRYGDDGEPQGTAGLPMLEVFRREGVTDLVCVVTRYFGGVLLGAGGLFRAYTKTAKDALDAAGVAVVRRWEETEFSCSYAAAESLKRELAAFDGVVTDTLYAADVTVKALVPEEKSAAFAARILDLSAGAVQLRTVGESFRAVRVR